MNNKVDFGIRNIDDLYPTLLSYYLLLLEENKKNHLRPNIHFTTTLELFEVLADNIILYNRKNKIFEDIFKTNILEEAYHKMLGLWCIPMYGSFYPVRLVKDHLGIEISSIISFSNDDFITTSNILIYNIKHEPRDYYFSKVYNV